MVHLQIITSISSPLTVNDRQHTVSVTGGSLQVLIQMQFPSMHQLNLSTSKPFSEKPSPLQPMALTQLGCVLGGVYVGLLAEYSQPEKVDKLTPNCS